MPVSTWVSRHKVSELAWRASLACGWLRYSGVGLNCLKDQTFAAIPILKEGLDIHLHPRWHDLAIC